MEEKETKIGYKTAINGGKNSNGKTKIFVILPQRVVDVLKVEPGDELEIGTIIKTGRKGVNSRKNNFLKKKNDIQDEPKSVAPEANCTVERGPEVGNPEQTEQLPQLPL